MKEKDFTQDLTESEEQQYLVDRDVSWLSFNYRVLQEALDESVPLLERLKFLAIYSSNLDEFFRVRVSNHRNLVRVGKKTKRKLEYDPEEVLNRVLEIVNEQQEEFSRIFASQLIPELELQNINLLHYSDLNDEQVEYVTTYFNDKMLPFVQPVLLVRKKIRPFLNNAALYLTMILRTKGQRRSRNQYAIVKIPSDHLPRF
ncbi:MAG: polyphosphate kinase 1, partial [Bacteroidota bacterium]